MRRPLKALDKQVAVNRLFKSGKLLSMNIIKMAKKD